MPRKGLNGMLNEKSRLSIVDTTQYKQMMLDPESLVPSEENFYSMENIEELADNMCLVGHLDPIIVGKVDGNYKIISGHRRTKAAVWNKQHGRMEFNEVKCLVREMTNTMFMLTLLSANAFNRKLSDWEQVEQAKQLKEYLVKAKEEGMVIEGKMRDYMADMLGVSKTKMSQIDKINNNLCEEGKEALKQGDINFTKAHETAGLPVEKQIEVIHNPEITAQKVKEIVKGTVSETDTSEKQDVHGGTIKMTEPEKLKSAMGLPENSKVSVSDTDKKQDISTEKNHSASEQVKKIVNDAIKRVSETDAKKVTGKFMAAEFGYSEAPIMIEQENGSLVEIKDAVLYEDYNVIVLKLKKNTQG